MKAKFVNIESFCLRQFTPSYKGTYISSLTPEQVEDKINEHVQQLISKSSGGFDSILVDGYAPFCKHIFLQNFIEDVYAPTVEITPKTVHLLKSGYEARTANELPVLERWFNKKDLLDNGFKFQKAKYLDVILYSREQIIAEDITMQAKINSTPLSEKEFEEKKAKALKENKLPSYGIISIKAQDVEYEIPMSVSSTIHLFVY